MNNLETHFFPIKKPVKSRKGGRGIQSLKPEYKKTFTGLRNETKWLKLCLRGVGGGWGNNSTVFEEFREGMRGRASFTAAAFLFGGPGGRRVFLSRRRSNWVLWQGWRTNSNTAGQTTVGTMARLSC